MNHVSVKRALLEIRRKKASGVYVDQNLAPTPMVEWKRWKFIANMWPLSA